MVALRHFEECFQAVGECLVRGKDPEIPLLAIQLFHVAQETSERIHSSIHRDDSS